MIPKIQGVEDFINAFNKAKMSMDKLIEEVGVDVGDVEDAPNIGSQVVMTHEERQACDRLS